MATIIPAILTDSEDVYKSQLEQAEHVSDIIQVDIVDGKFAQNTTIGTEIVARHQSSASLEIQIMAVDSLSYISALAGLEYVFRIIIPFEKNLNLKECIWRIKRARKQVGVSLNPATRVSATSHLVNIIDLLLLLGVEPGFSGQEFKVNVINKIKEARKLSRSLPIEVDGGVNFETTPKIVGAGANFLAANSVLFNAPDFYVAFEKLAKLARWRSK